MTQFGFFVIEVPIPFPPNKEKLMETHQLNCISQTLFPTPQTKHRTNLTYTSVCCFLNFLIGLTQKHTHIQERERGETISWHLRQPVQGTKADGHMKLPLWEESMAEHGGTNNLKSLLAWL